MRLAQIKNRVALVVFILFLSLLCWVAWFNPFYNWDIIPYTALVDTASSDPVKLHDAAYRAVSVEVPPQATPVLLATGPDPEFRRNMAKNPWHFAEQLPFYSVKPFYILVLAAIRGAGLGAITAARIISLVSFAAFGIVLFLWLRPLTGALLASISSCFLLATAEFLGGGAQTEPDALFSALALAGLYLIFARKKLFPGWCLLALVPLVRSDGLVLVALMVAYLAFKSPGFSWRYGLTILAVEILTSLAVGRLGGDYSFQTLFYHSFVNRLVAPAESIVHVTASDYFHALYIFVLGSLATPRPLFFLLGLVSLKARGTPSLLRDLAWLGLAFAAVHIVLFPLPDSRFLELPFALFVLWAAGSLATGYPRSLPRPDWWR
jgi:hypothetical protein